MSRPNPKWACDSHAFALKDTVWLRLRILIGRLANLAYYSAPQPQDEVQRYLGDAWGHNNNIDSFWKILRLP